MRFCKVLLLLAAMSAAAVSVRGYSSPSDTITAGASAEVRSMMRKISDDYIANPSGAAVDSLLSILTTDGSFSDLDYADTQRTNWIPSIHLERMLLLSQAYTLPSNPRFQDKALFDAVDHCMRFWIEKKPKSSNWWWNVISTPKHLGLTMIKMRDGKQHLQKATEDSLLCIMDKQIGNAIQTQTGANLTDVALNCIFSACLRDDAPAMEYAIERFVSPVVYTTKEGFQHDGSYMQHGQQLYIGGYGEALLETVTRVGVYAIGTKFAFPPDKVDILSRFMRDTYYAAMRGPIMAFGVQGRSITRVGMADKSFTVDFARRMIEIDPAHAAEYREIIARITRAESPSFGIKPRHTNYFRSDYALHVRPGYMFDVRYVSDRALRLEHGNMENLYGYFMSDGSTCISVTGDEYFNIFPLWNWCRIPGTTTPQLKEIPRGKAWSQPGTSKFAGGVTDGTDGVAVYSYFDDNDFNGIRVSTGAMKSWFFFNNEVVCLGADITSANDAEINTTLNQCYLAGAPVMVADRKNVTLHPLGSASYSDPSWILHNGIGYFFPAGGNLNIETGTRGGSWHDFNTSQPDGIVSGEVFTAYFNHGIKPQGDKYAYTVVPGINDADAAFRYSEANATSILSNTPQIQAVRSNTDRLTGIVFYQAGKLDSDSFTVSVDSPCVIMVHDNGTFHLADPSQSQRPVNVELHMKNTGATPVNVTVDLSNSGIHAGDSFFINQSIKQCVR